MDRLTKNFNASRLADGLATLALLYSIDLFTYRLTIDPLVKFPGPKDSAVTSWYEFYYDYRNGARGDIPSRSRRCTRNMVHTLLMAIQYRLGYCGQ